MIIEENKCFYFDRGKKVDVKYITKTLLYPFINIIYKLIFLFRKRDNRKCLYYLSVVSIFKNESLYLKEWIEYHLIVGVEHFYLYNNNSEDIFMEVLQPYIDRGIVTLKDWPEYPGQVKAYKDWYDTRRGESNWVALIDLDEFLCPRYCDSMKPWLERYSKYPTVLTYWKFFGTSGVLDLESDKPMIEQLTSSYEKPINMGKILYNTRYDIYTFDKGMMHICYGKLYGLPIPPVNEQYNFVLWDIHHFKNHPLSVQLNHYWSRSYGAYRKKKNRGGGMSGKWVTDSIFWRNESHNWTKDYTIFKYLLKLKLRTINNGKQDF